MKEEYQAVLDGTSRKFKGQEKRDFLKRVEEDANDNHMQVEASFACYLEHARLAGDALRVAQRITGKRLKWSRWRNNHFAGSQRTAQVYMQISRHWDDPRISAARQEGSIDSIRDFLHLLQGDHDVEPPPRSEEELLVASIKHELKERFSDWLGRLSDEQFRLLAKDGVVDVLMDKFDWLWEKLQRDAEKVTAVGARRAAEEAGKIKLQVQRRRGSRRQRRSKKRVAVAG